MKRKLPIGIEDFKEVKTHCYYVDKTMLLEDLFARGESAVFLYARPRRFGKSLTLSMINYFFSDRYDSRALFEGTAFAAAEPEKLEQLNSRNVVRLNLKSLEAPSFEVFVEALSSKMSRLYDEQFRSKDGLSKAESEYVEATINETLPLPKLEESLERICELAFKQKGRKTMILIDEYDAPYQSGYENGYLDKAEPFLKNFLGNALKGNEFLSQAVLTGVTPVAKSSVFSDLNNVVVNTVLGDRPFEHFGFDAKETKDLLAYFGFTGDFTEVAQWYDGYVFQRKQVFNPWSILSFVDNGFSFKPYWVKTGANALVKKCLDLYVGDQTSDLFGKLMGEGLYAELDENVDFSSLSGERPLLSLLVLSGYLSADRNPLGMGALVAIPNEETRQAFRREIADYVAKSDKLGIMMKLRRALLNGEGEKVGDLLSRYVLESFSYLDLTSEKSYQLIINTLAALLFDDFVVDSEFPAGSGRADMYMRSKNDKSNAFVFELKYLKGRKETERLVTCAQKALAQIRENDYTADARRFGYENIHLYGIAFSGKRCHVASEALR